MAESFAELKSTTQNKIRRCIAWKLEQLPDTCVYICEDGQVRAPNQDDRKLLENKEVEEWAQEFINPVRQRFPKIEKHDNKSRILVIMPLEDDPQHPGLTCFVKAVPIGATVDYPVFGRIVRLLVQ